MPSNPPDGFHTVTPISIVEDPDRLIGFVEGVLGGHVERRFNAPDGSVAHAEVRIGDSLVMIGPASEQYAAFPAMGVRLPRRRRCRLRLGAGVRRHVAAVS